MKKIKAILWGLLELFKSPFRRKLSFQEQEEELVTKFNFLGSSKRPYSNAVLFQYNPKTLTLTEAILLKGERGETRGFITPGSVLIWALNRKVAKKKCLKQFGHEVE